MPKCYVCGGTDFVNEEGFLYCSECQTRCKDVSEQVFDSWGGAQHESKTRISEQQKTAKHEDNWTTWEGYNYVLKGMVDELIELGATPKLKIVVFQLWARYLRTIHVAFLKHGKMLPKLGPLYCERDARVLFSWPAKNQSKKKRSKSNASVISSDTSSVSRVRARAKAKRALIRAEHDKDSTLCSDADSSNISDQLSASSGASFSKVSQPILNRKNRYMIEEAFIFDQRLRKRERSLKKEPWRSKVKIKSCDPTYLNKIKLLAIIHLGLLLCEEDIQLSDLLRWIQEGHLSYCSVNHFLPEKMAGRIKGIEFKGLSPTHSVLRSVAGKLAKELQIKSLPIPSLPNLIRRYAEELELPGDLANFAVLLWDDYQPEMPLWCEVVEGRTLYSSKCIIPNYEGRAMGFLLFAMKLIFGLDGYTEELLSTFAHQANEILDLSSNKSYSEIQESPELPCKYFVWKDWVKYIEFRTSLISRWHYPMYAAQESGIYQLNHAKKNVIPVSPPLQDAKKFLNFCQHAVESKSKAKDETTGPKWTQFMKKHLQDLAEVHSMADYNIKYLQPSKTPCHSYMNELCNINNWEIQEECIENNPCNELLHAKFSLSTIDFILKPLPVIEALKLKNVHVDLIKGSALGKENVKFCEPWNLGKFKRDDFGFLHVNLTNKPLDTEKNKRKLNWLTLDDKNDFLNKIQTLEDEHLKVELKDKSKSSTRKRSREKPHAKDTERKKSGLTKNSTDLQRLQLLLPYRQVWMFYGAFQECTEEKFSDLCLRMPLSFSWLLQLCADLLEMTKLSLYVELVNVELIHKHIKQVGRIHTQGKQYECDKIKIPLSKW